MSSKNNMDHYKTASQSRLSENLVDAIRTGSTVSANPSARLRYLRRLRRRRRVKGLSARQLWERKNSQRATKQLNLQPATRQSVNDGVAGDAL